MPSPEVLEPPRGLSFGDLLDWHLRRGTRPPGSDKQGEPWKKAAFAGDVGVSDKQVRNWIANKSLPNDIITIERVLFGRDQEQCTVWRMELRDALKRTRTSSAPTDLAPARHIERARPGALSAPQLSIVVLPFANLGGDPEQDHFVDGITESLTTDLSRIRGSFVIGRHTAFTYKGKAVDLKQVGRELKVHYVLEGSVQHGSGRLRVNVQLVHAETSAHLWADRFDKPVADLFDMQDEIVSRLANALNTQLIKAEARRAERSPHPDAMDLYFQGRAWATKGSIPEYMTKARGFFERALAIDPQSTEALVGMATVDAAMGGALLTDDRTARFSAAETNAIKALSLVPDHAIAHWVLGSVYNFTNRAAQGIAKCEQALALDRNLAGAHCSIGLAKCFKGQAAETERHIREAFRLSPRDINAHQWMHVVGMAKIQLGADAEAAGWLRRSIESNRNFPPAHFWFAAALGLVGDLDEAQTAAKAGLALNPGFTIRRMGAVKPSDNPTFVAGLERAWMGMRLAGVPEV